MHTRGIRLFYEAVSTLIGILELLAWIVSVLALSAAVTYLVVRATQKLEARREAQAAAVEGGDGQADSS